MITWTNFLKGQSYDKIGITDVANKFAEELEIWKGLLLLNFLMYEKVVV